MENLDLFPKWDWAQKTSFLNELPKIDKLPECEFDPKYTFSFDCSDLSIIAEREIRNFFDEFGFVVLRNVFTKEDCQKTRNAMWEILESGSPQLKRDDYKTWNQLKGKGQYGLSIRGPSFHPQLVSNRQNPKLAQALTILTQASSTSNLIVSQDRFTVYRATQFDDETIPGESFSTGDRNLHLDMNPWWWEENANEILDGLDKALLYEDDQDFIKENNLIVSSMGRHVQCVLNFENNEEEDGGTLIVPYFHRYLKTWNKVHEKQLRKPLPWVTLTKDVERQYLTYAHRVPMREGSVLIWDQRVLHGTAPNKSKRCRLAQYLKAFPRNLTYPLDRKIITEELKEKEEGILSQEEEISHPRLLRRSKAIYQRLALSNQIEHLSEIGHYLFGFDILSSR